MGGGVSVETESCAGTGCKEREEQEVQAERHLGEAEGHALRPYLSLGCLKAWVAYRVAAGRIL